MGLLDSQEVGTLVESGQRDAGDRNARIAIRRALLFRDKQGHSDQELGINIPAPFDKSNLIIQFMSGTLMDGAQNIVAALTTNQPSFQVNRVTVAEKELSDRVLKHAAAEEASLNATLHEARRSGNHQQRIAWSQTVEGAGWYHSLPREATFGLPQRAYFEDATDANIMRMIETGDAIWTTDPRDNERKPAESADLWAKRRMEDSKQRALDGKTIFHVESLPHRLVVPEYDGSGLARGMILEEIPQQLLGPHTDIARATAKFKQDDEFATLGITVNSDGNIVKGIPPGDSRNAAKDNTVLFARIFDREYMYYYVGSTGRPGQGAILWSSPHNLGHVPLYPAPAFTTDSRNTAQMFVPLLDGEFAFTPLINQAATLLSQAATYNAIPRYVIIRREDGVPILDERTGDPKIITHEQVIGMNPEQVAVVHGGELRQLKVEDTGLLLSVLQFYLTQEQPTLPSAFETGSLSGAGASGPAWQTLLMQRAGSKQYEEAIEGHRQAIREMGSMWVQQLRYLNTKIFFLSAPERRKDGMSRRGLIELDTKTLSEDIQVRQSSTRAEERITLEQSGLVLREKGAINDYEMYDRYFEKDDPEAAAMDAHVQRVADGAFYGPSALIPEGSLAFDIAQAARGEAVERLLLRSPAFARSAAEMSLITPNAQQGSDSFNRGGGGPLNQVTGTRVPGSGMGTTPNALPPLQSPVGPAATPSRVAT